MSLAINTTIPEGIVLAADSHNPTETERDG